MKANQSGFLMLAAVLAVAAVLLAAIGVFVYQAQIAKPNIAPVPVVQKTENPPNQPAESEKETKTKTAEPEKLPESENIAAILADKNVDYSGEYSYFEKYDDGASDSGTLVIKQISEDEIIFDLLVLNYQSHFGDINNGKAKLNGNVAIYDHKDEFHDEPCRLKITLTNKTAAIGTMNDGGCDAPCGFGMNVCADGVYTKKIGGTPKDFTKFANYIPVGWQIKAKEEGDLNKDGILDAALVIEDAVEDDPVIDWRYCADRKCGCAKTQDCARKLMLFFGKIDGGYELSLESDEAILLADEGGSFGDPFQRLEINNGSILLNFYGGSNWRWEKIYRFRYQNSSWFLIGKTANDYYSGCSNEIFQSVDANYLTGKTETITGDGWADGGNVREGFECGPYSATQKGTGVWSDVGIRSLINLKNFDPRIN